MDRLNNLTQQVELSQHRFPHIGSTPHNYGVLLPPAGMLSTQIDRWYFAMDPCHALSAVLGALPQAHCGPQTPGLPPVSLSACGVHCQVSQKVPVSTQLKIRFSKDSKVVSLSSAMLERRPPVIHIVYID